MEVYRATPELAAARDWLARNGSPEDVVAASWDVANYLAGAIPGRALGGHPVATVSAEQRKATTRQLFADSVSQERLLRAEAAHYVVSMGSHEPLFVAGADLVYSQGKVRVFRVRRQGS
jgi:hypothetical protein